jgi:hypothetical protein
MNNWYKISQTVPKEYMIEKGLLYDENADEVFSFKDLIRFKVPLFKTPQQANEFLTNLEKVTKKQWGRVPEIDYLKKFRYKETIEERNKAHLEHAEQRSNEIMRGQLYSPKTKA